MPPYCLMRPPIQPPSFVPLKFASFYHLCRFLITSRDVRLGRFHWQEIVEAIHRNHRLDAYYELLLRTLRSHFCTRCFFVSRKRIPSGCLATAPFSWPKSTDPRLPYP